MQLTMDRAVKWVGKVLVTDEGNREVCWTGRSTPAMLNYAPSDPSWSVIQSNSCAGDGVTSTAAASKPWQQQPYFSLSVCAKKDKDDSRFKQNTYLCVLF